MSPAKGQVIEVCLVTGAEVIIGATTLDQLKENLDAFEGDAGLSEDVLQQIDEIHLKLRNPGTFLWKSLKSRRDVISKQTRTFWFLFSSLPDLRKKDETRHTFFQNHFGGRPCRGKRRAKSSCCSVSSSTFVLLCKKCTAGLAQIFFVYLWDGLIMGQTCEFQSCMTHLQYIHIGQHCKPWFCQFCGMQKRSHIIPPGNPSLKNSSVFFWGGPILICSQISCNDTFSQSFQQSFDTFLIRARWLVGAQMQQWLAASLAVFVLPVTLAVDGQSFKASDEEADRNWAAFDFVAYGWPKRVKRLVPWWAKLINGHSKNPNWRYQPHIRPMWGYTATPKIWPCMDYIDYMVQYLHFRINSHWIDSWQMDVFPHHLS